MSERSEETIKCLHCPERVRVEEQDGLARIEQHFLYSGKLCSGSNGKIRGKWRDDPTYRKVEQKGK